MTGIVAYLLAISALIVLLLGLGVLWAVRSGQFDDLEGPAHRILMDDDDPLIPRRRPQAGDPLNAAPTNESNSLDERNAK